MHFHHIPYIISLPLHLYHNLAHILFISILSPRVPAHSLSFHTQLKMHGGEANGTAVPRDSLYWNFSQVFGERVPGEQVNERDIISAIEFDKSGHHLATGDQYGRVVLFERTDTKEHIRSRRDAERIDYSKSRRPEFRYMTEFKSHEPEFDYLKSVDFDETINKIRWWQPANGSLFLLSTNDKTIKFWKVQEKKVKKICKMNLDLSKSCVNGIVSRSTVSSGHLANGGSSDVSFDPLSNTDFCYPPGGIASLRLPVVSSNASSPKATCRRVYGRAHDFRINSISCNSDGETFISADDLRINLWNLETNSQTFNIVDLKPERIEDLTDLITSAEFNPTHCNTLAYSTSLGLIRLVDLRQSTLCNNHFKQFGEPVAPDMKRFFSDLLASISDIKFVPDGRYLLSRDYLTLKLWDINMDSRPVSTFQVHEYSEQELHDLYDKNCVEEKFECCVSGDGQRVASGAYSIFRVFGTAEGSTEATTVEASRYPMRRQIQTPSRPSGSHVATRGGESPVLNAYGNSDDYKVKLLNMAWHPSENLVACAVINSLYMYYA